MKLKLVTHNDSIFLLTCAGDSTRMTYTSAREFLLNFSDARYYGVQDNDAGEIFLMGDLDVDTVAEVDDNGHLIVKNAVTFRDIIVKAETDYLTVTEFAALHGKSVASVRRMCQNERIPGAVHRGSVYLIPANASYPVK